MNLLNKFTLIGYLSEIRVDLFRSHIKVKLSIDLQHHNITCYATISRRFNKEWYHEFEVLLSRLVPKQDGWVYVNGEQYYRMDSYTQPSCLFLSGNISSSGDMIFFNFEYCKILNEQLSSSVSIEIEGQFVDKDKFLNIVSDSPRIFNLKRHNQAIDGKIYKAWLQYNPSYRIQDDTIYPVDISKLTLARIEQTKKQITEEQLQDYLLEWKIINNQ
jgi:hypothetical protein|uniref:Uncharacterized protein n=1 Tax=Siphoviridae sp. ct0Wl9 TaxID=2827763 RepID=A0A8S5T8R3_9CAUD|nr:MAG TPA: hypothetical protein [Siphoviridae sp. ct0Wl9]